MNVYAILVFFYPVACGAIAEVFRARPVVRTLAWIAAFLPLSGLLAAAVRGGAGHRLDQIMIAAVMAGGWCILFWTGRKLGKPINEMLAERRNAETAAQLEDQFR